MSEARDEERARAGGTEIALASLAGCGWTVAGVVLTEWTADFLINRPSWVDLVQDLIPSPF